MDPLLLLLSTLTRCFVAFQFHCCGAENYTDWLESSGWKRNNSVPDSCCRVEREDCGNNITAGNIYYKVKEELQAGVGGKSKKYRTVPT